MKIDSYKNGLFVRIRSVQEDDAEFIIKLRTDEKNARFISKTSTDINAQINWIMNQISRVNDYYFLIEDLRSNEKIGTISIYDIKQNNAELGRWLSYGNSIQNIDSIILAYDFGFETCKLDYIDTFTMKENINVVNFHKNFGADFIKKLEAKEYNENIGQEIMQYRVTKEKYYATIRPKQIELIRNFL